MVYCVIECAEALHASAWRRDQYDLGFPNFQVIEQAGLLFGVEKINADYDVEVRTFPVTSLD